MEKKTSQDKCLRIKISEMPDEIDIESLPEDTIIVWDEPEEWGDELWESLDDSAEE